MGLIIHCPVFSLAVPGVKPEAAAGSFKDNPSGRGTQLGGCVIRARLICGGWRQPARGACRARDVMIPHSSSRAPPLKGGALVGLSTHLCSHSPSFPEV